MNALVYRTVLKILSLRGYPCTGEEAIQKHAYYSYFTIKRSEKTMAIIQFQMDTIKIEQIRFLVDWIQSENWQQVLLIVKHPLKSNLRDTLFYQLKHCSVQVFLEHELFFDVTQHVSVPSHQLLNTDDVKKKVLQPYRCTVKQLPKLSAEDIVCRFYGYKKNDVIEITRASESVGICKEYKVVI